MDIQLSQTEWYTQPALQMESDAFRVVTVPGVGGKIVSLFDIPSGREWLLPPQDKPFQPVAYGAVFIDQDMSGWDEMFPTIDACEYPRPGVFQGARVPDHGEVWALEWAVEQAEPGGVRLEVAGRVLPYRLARTMTFIDSRSLCLRYELTNTGTEPIVGLWAAHPQFRLAPDTVVRLPAEVRNVINIEPISDLGPIGSHHPWPVTRAHEDKPVALDRVTSIAYGEARKYCLPPDQAISWAALHDERAETSLRLSWDAAEIPYFAIWMENCNANTTATIALEPMTGYYDSLSYAWRESRVPVLQPGEKKHWSVTVSVAAL